jgi:hypothetical protein
MKQRTIKVKSATTLLKKFDAVFPDDNTCLQLLAELKWKDGFVCKHCGHDNWCHGKVLSSRRCTKCKHEESATAHTIFHHCRFSVKTAFELSLLICHIPDISSYELSRQVDLRHMTCYNFQRKMISCRQGEPENELFSELLLEIGSRLVEVK